MDFPTEEPTSSVLRGRNGEDCHQQGFLPIGGTSQDTPFSPYCPFPSSPVTPAAPQCDRWGFQCQQRSSLGAISHSLCNLSRILGQSSRGHKISIPTFPRQDGQAVDHCWSRTQRGQEGLPGDYAVTWGGRRRDGSKQTKSKADQCSMSAVKHIGICSATKRETSVPRTLQESFVMGI